jgi:hypothetical protein
MNVRASSERRDEPSTYEGDVAISAVELARMARVTPADVHYWGRSRYLEKRRNGSSAYPLSQIPKALLMGILVKQLHMDAGNASKLADQLVPVYANRPDSAEAIRTLALAVERKIEALVCLLMDTGFVEQIGDLLKKENRNGGGP